MDTTKPNPEMRTTFDAPLRTRSFQSESNVGFQFDRKPFQISHRKTGEAVKLRPVAELQSRPNWRPGAEPGLDPQKPNGGRVTTPIKNKECIVMITDFSDDAVTKYKADNGSLEEFLGRSRPDPERFCRWINVHGLSWDVIEILGKQYDLSHLALEDLVNPKTRTKADWYKDHMFIVLTLQRLMEIADSDSDKNSIGSDEIIVPRDDKSGLRNRLCRAIPGLRNRTTALPTTEDRGGRSTGFIANPNPLDPTKAQIPNKRQYRTLQEFHGGANAARIDYLEASSPLRQESLEVMVEQVAIFITSNNEIISFFETSAEEIEEPLMRRLAAPSTIIRQSADASMVAQGLIDVIVDLSFPIAAAFKNAIDQMEIDVLTEKPDKEYANLFYILKSEILGSKSLMNPITKMIQTLRNHRKLAIQTHGEHAKIPSTTVTISELTNMYLGDVEDHSIMIEENLDRMLMSCGEISDLIFNTLNIDTNNTMKTLTFITASFLPAQFLSGYFGMNFTKFSVLSEDVTYFWKIAIPVTVLGLSILNWRTVRDRFYKKKQRQIWKKKRIVRERQLKMSWTGT